ncbi:MAG TPA: histidinol-phosphate transaminase [Actinomycetota bacterium]|nr:histidinol-phosphate transaminase [Actinomycetota bacterium]
MSSDRGSPRRDAGLGELPALEARADLVSIEAYTAPQLPARHRLSTNESPYPAPRSVTQRIVEEMASADLNRYPDRRARGLVDALAQHNEWPSEGVWAANGSNEVFLHLMLAFGGPNRSVLMFDPTYSLHATIPRIAGTNVDHMQRTPEFLIDLDDAVKAVRLRRPEIIMVCSPNNPSGGCEPIATVRTLLEETTGLVVVDEAYGEFAAPDESVRSLLDDYPNLVLVKTMSKAWSLAGVRLGYMLGSPALVSEMAPVRIPYHLSTITQVAGEAALAASDALRETVESITIERDRLIVGLQAMGVLTFPSRANFVLFRVDDAASVWKQLLEREVLVRSYSDQIGLNDCLRVTAGLPEDTDAFLSAMGDVLDD